MDVKSEIEHCSPCRQLSELSGRSEHEDLLGRHLHELVLIICSHRVTLRAERILQRLPDSRKPFVQCGLMAYSLV